MFVYVVELVQPSVFYCAYGCAVWSMQCRVCVCVVWDVVLVRIGGLDVCLGLG